jgi:hypothetical protein
MSSPAALSPAVAIEDPVAFLAAAVADDRAAIG